MSASTLLTQIMDRTIVDTRRSVLLALAMRLTNLPSQVLVQTMCADLDVITVPMWTARYLHGISSCPTPLWTIAAFVMGERHRILLALTVRCEDAASRVIVQRMLRDAQALSAVDWTRCYASVTEVARDRAC